MEEKKLRKIRLSNEYISSFSLQISLLIHAGINIADGLFLLMEDENDKDIRDLLEFLANKVDEGHQLSDAMRESNAFPSYVVNMAATGEETGRTEAAFNSLTEYYEGQRELNDRIRNAVLYPAILMVLMLIIIGVLLVKVLPIFNTVYNQLGGSLSGIAAGLLGLGKGIHKALPVIMGILIVAIVLGIIIMFSNAVRSKFHEVFVRYFGDTGLTRKIATSRFASALSMGMMSGLPMEEALKSAMSFTSESRGGKTRYNNCMEKLEAGSPLADALRDAKIFAPMYCRMLALGVKSGAGDTVMAEIARRLQDEVTAEIDIRVGRIEPTIVIVTSVIVGIILLSVMLPLMNIMSAIG